MSNSFTALIENLCGGKIRQFLASVVKNMIAIDITDLYTVALYVVVYDLDHIENYIIEKERPRMIIVRGQMIEVRSSSQRRSQNISDCSGRSGSR